MTVRRGFSCSPNCETCGLREVESILHLFFKCPKAFRLWDRLESILGVRLMMALETIHDTWNSLMMNAACSGMGKNSGWYTSYQLVGRYGSKGIQRFLKEKDFQ
ncbi:hypothetical protein FCM35_KLT05269 [Carex littledalei]|uniref:Reverse transcriptase zinc-binding domain-containing protein n=1 Tax=Carex littledalei TaxID=544730 RepID=A0A833VP65_9POAL|nr:hypothetical protein FCM35_KLT05269 [Carex littledalei]